MVTGSVTHARNLCDDVEWSAQDATRTERDFLGRCVEAAIKAGATTINMPDTVGYTYPGRIRRACSRPDRERVPGADRWSSRPTATTTWAWPSPTLSPACRPARGRSNGGQRHRRAGRQRRARGGGDGAAGARRQAAVPDRHRHPAAHPRQPLRLGHHRLSGAVQQGHRRQERLRPRERHPPGRHAEERRDLRDHAARGRRREGGPPW